MDPLRENLIYIINKLKKTENGWSELAWIPSVELLEEVLKDLDKERGEHTETIACYEAMKEGVQVRINDLEQKNADLRQELQNKKNIGKIGELY